MFGRVPSQFALGTDGLVPVPEPLLRPVVNGPRSAGKKARNQCGLIEPRGEDAVQDNAFEVRRGDADRSEIGRVVEPAQCIVVGCRVPGEFERHVQAACGFVEDLPFELPVGARRLLGFVLARLPATGHRQQQVAIEFNLVL